VVEDTERGLRAALAAGLRCLVIPGPLTDGADFSGATALLRQIGEVLTAIVHLDGTPGPAGLKANFS
jgi:beta-phosphoglucomutase-like phosphatase (HAD superfamily)